MYACLLSMILSVDELVCGRTFFSGLVLVSVSRRLSFACDSALLQCSQQKGMDDFARSV